MGIWVSAPSDSRFGVARGAGEHERAFGSAGVLGVNNLDEWRLDCIILCNES